MLEYIRIGCAVPAVTVGNVKKNTRDICDCISRADGCGCDLVVFPELAMTGYTCADLFFQRSLQEAVLVGLQDIVACSKSHRSLTAVVGLPVLLNGQLYNAAAVITAGKVDGIAVKTYLPNYDCAKERRWFAPAACLERKEISAAQLGIRDDYTVPVGNDLLFRLDDTLVGVEICEDLWAPVSPSSLLSLAGAEVIVNPAASHQLAGRKTVRHHRIKDVSERNLGIYAFCSAGTTESAQDLLYSGHSVIAQCGTVLAENAETLQTDYLLVRDADLGAVRAERCRNTTFRDAAQIHRPAVRICQTEERPLRGDGTEGAADPMPYMPADPRERTAWCLDTFEIQVTGLMNRLKLLGSKAVIGVSGGLDSTLALLVAVEAMIRLQKPVSDVHGITMPCFGTTDATASNAHKLMKLLGITAKEIDIRDAVSRHFRDIGQDPNTHDTTYENAQARERTQVLMDYAGRIGGIVVGTGDLSELALGWCTYNGDHMSMYAVNSSVPKTAIPMIIEAVAQKETYSCAKTVLADIIATPISPELLPPSTDGMIAQRTEDLVGPYILHDFFIYYTVRYGYSPKKIFALANRAFVGKFDAAAIKKWLQTFYRRFFTQQFKRNCQPDGIRTGIISFSPRSDWHMPSDASASLWLQEAEDLQ